MAFFALTSDITIGNLQFSGVHEVRIKKSIHSYSDIAYIKIPSRSRVKKGNKISELQTTGNLIADRDYVVIKLGYNGVLQEEFRGFVKRRNLDMPLEVECEGFVQSLRLDVDKTFFYPSTKASTLLGLIAEETAAKSAHPIKVLIGNDLDLINIKANHVNGVEIIDAIKRISQGILTIFFIQPDVLWCGLTYTAYRNGNDPFALGQVDYRLGYNVVKDNGLKEKTPYEQVEVLFSNTLATGQKVQTASDIKVAKRKEKSVFNNVGNVNDLKGLANEKMYQVNYSGYEGWINGFLQPYCQPGWKVNIRDDRYPERNGVYLCESTDVTFGVQGARRRVEIGPKIGFIS